MVNFRSRDHKAEGLIAEFNDKHFYPHFGIQFRRENSLEMQYNGVDLTAITNRGESHIDEKAAITASNTILPTFAFEVDSIQKGAVIPGWFVTHNLTDTYVLCYPTYFDDNYKRISPDAVTTRGTVDNGINTMCYLVVRKKSIKDFLCGHGVTDEFLLEQAKRMRGIYSADTSEFLRLDKSGEFRIKINDNLLDGIYNPLNMKLSTGVAEKPINLVIKRQFLERLGGKVYFVNWNGHGYSFFKSLSRG